ncbi:MAG: glycosyltransferase [Bacteroidetes bacterium]|nr:glycosyltransferase [Bacteroidota bacterium]
MISVFIPVFNEAHSLKQNLDKIDLALRSMGEPFELFIVDDGSTDETSVIAQGIVADKENYDYLKYENGPSRRENLAASFVKGKGDILMFMDEDLATDLGSLNELVDGIRQGYDIVTGSRYTKGSHTNRTFRRYLYSKVYNIFLGVLFGSPFTDHQCGFKAFKREVIVKLTDKLGYDHSFKRGWFWDAEMLIRAKRSGYKVLEIPVIWNESNSNTFKVYTESKMLPYVIKLRFRL